jgi:hypothetical protein
LFGVIDPLPAGLAVKDSVTSIAAKFAVIAVFPVIVIVVGEAEPEREPAQPVKR